MKSPITHFACALSLTSAVVMAPSLARADDTAVAPAHSEVEAKPKKVDDGKHHQILKGAMAGAVVGHYAGHHAVRGAIVGATVGAVKRHHDKKEAKKRAAEAENGAH